MEDYSTTSHTCCTMILYYIIEFSHFSFLAYWSIRIILWDKEKKQLIKYKTSTLPIIPCAYSDFSLHCKP